jgi:hypothetical protein
MSKSDKLGGTKADVLKEAVKIGKEAKASGLYGGKDAKEAPKQESVAMNANKSKQKEIRR